MNSGHKYPKNEIYPEISIVIPALNEPFLLLRCLTSLINQTISSRLYEIIIIIEDVKDNKIEKIIQNLRQKTLVSFKYFQTYGKNGPAAARNIGWKNATGKIIAFTDDDAIPQLDWLQKGLREMKNGAKVLVGKTIVPTSSKPCDYELDAKKLEKAEFLTANLFILRSILKEINGFDEEFTEALRGDNDLHFSLLEKNIPVRYSAKAKIIHPVRKVNWFMSLKDQKKSMFNALLFKKHPELFRQKIQKYPPFNYYLNLSSLFLLTMFVVMRNSILLIASYIFWVFLFNQIIFKRLKKSSRSVKNIIEIIVTSFFIPPLSVFWRIYGALKYRVLFI